MMTLTARNWTRKRGRRPTLLFQVVILVSVVILQQVWAGRQLWEGPGEVQVPREAAPLDMLPRPTIGKEEAPATLLSSQDGNSVQVNTTKPWKYFPWQLPDRKKEPASPHEQEWAIFVISMGESASKFRIVERLWLSVRRRGDFFGPLVVITDAPDDRYLGIQEADPHFYQLRPNAADFVVDIAFVDTAMPYKRFKTFLVDYFLKKISSRAKNVQFVAYLDADIVVGKPLQPWLDHCQEQLTRPDNPSPILFFEGNTLDMPIQSGQFALDVTLAQPCLGHWRRLIDSHPSWDEDQYSLKELAEQKPSDCRNMLVVPQEPWLTFVKKYTIGQLLKDKEFTTLMHVQNTGHARYMQDKHIQHFVREVLELTPSEQELNWKTPIKASPEWSQGRVSKGE